MNDRFWFIFHKREPLAWSNKFGWVSDKGNFDVYSDAEKTTAVFPIEGRWVEWLS